jgi:AcrR family transcriptional regulator
MVSIMKADGKSNGTTRDHLLDAACRVFAEKGFRDATISEICDRAGANIAAVNYYFGNKETLYVEAWRLAFHHSIEAYPPDGDVGADASAEERLRGRVLSVIRRMTAEDNYGFRIMHKELANPTGLLEEVKRDVIQPFRREMSGIVRELLGPHASDKQVELCQTSIMSQCFQILVREHYQRVLCAADSKVEPSHPVRFSTEAIGDHIVRFSLAGIREMRREIESSRSDDSGDDS